MSFSPRFIRCNYNPDHWRCEKKSVTKPRTISCFLCEKPLAAVVELAFICDWEVYDEPVTSLVLLYAWVCVLWCYHCFVCMFNTYSWLVIYVGHRSYPGQTELRSSLYIWPKSTERLYSVFLLCFEVILWQFPQYRAWKRRKEFYFYQLVNICFSKLKGGA